MGESVNIWEIFDLLQQQAQALGMCILITATVLCSLLLLCGRSVVMELAPCLCH